MLARFLQACVASFSNSVAIFGLWEGQYGGGGTGVWMKEKGRGEGSRMVAKGEGEGQQQCQRTRKEKGEVGAARAVAIFCQCFSSFFFNDGFPHFQ